MSSLVLLLINIFIHSVPWEEHCPWVISEFIFLNYSLTLLIHFSTGSKTIPLLPAWFGKGNQQNSKAVCRGGLWLQVLNGIRKEPPSAQLLGCWNALQPHTFLWIGVNAKISTLQYLGSRSRFHISALTWQERSSTARYTAGHCCGCLEGSKTGESWSFVSLTYLSLLLCSAFFLQPLAIRGWSRCISAEESHSKCFLSGHYLCTLQLASLQPTCLTWLASLNRQKIKTGRCCAAQLSDTEMRNEPFAAQRCEHLKADLRILPCKKPLQMAGRILDENKAHVVNNAA